MGEDSTHSENRHRRLPGPNGSRLRKRRNALVAEWSLLSRILSWLPLALVILSLAGVAFASLVVRQRTKRMRFDLRSASEPTRLALGELRVGLAREQALAQRVTLAADSVYWTLYRRTTARDDSSLQKIGTAMRGLGPDARSAFATLDSTVTRWREVAAVDGHQHRSPAQLLDRIVRRGVTYEDLLRPTWRVDSVVSREMQLRRARIDTYEMFALRLTIFFVAIGVLASLAVLVLTLRGRHLHGVLERRAEQEIALSTLARALSGALAVPDVAGLTVDAAIQLSRVGGAYLAAAQDDRLVVLAARGTSESKAGKSLAVPRWLNGRVGRDQPRLFTAETRPRRDDRHGRPRREISSHLLVPMYHNGAIVGLLTLTSAEGRRTFSDSVARYGRALGDLAAVAMHRAEALHRERDARAQAEDAVRTRERVVSIVSHDLRNPLTAILGGADFLLEIIPDDEHLATVREQLQRMRHAATTMNRLIIDLLDIARLESGPLPMHFRELNIIQVIDNAFDLFQSSAQQHEVTLERPAAAELPLVWGDPDRLGQMLSNLLGNALKFTPKGGSVGVTVARHDNEGVELSVHDTGPGIPPERLQHLFDRFWHVTNGQNGGLGLGLSIVRAIAEAHGSKIRVENAAKGGTTVKIVLPPAAGREQREHPRLEKSVGSGEMSNGRRVHGGSDMDIAADD